MAKVFLSFKSEDLLKVWTLRGLSAFKNVDFEFDDVSLREAIDSKDESYIKSIIRPKIKKCDVCLCLIGENTHRSRKWIPWEVGLALEERIPVIAMHFKNLGYSTTPAILVHNDIMPFNWDIDRLFRKLSSY
ncbi:MAG: TIR domain-containing protein [Segetibacter sp.]